MKKIVLGFCLTLLLPIYSYADNNKSPCDSLNGDNMPVLMSDGQSKLVPVVRKDTDSKANYVVCTRYPQITGAALSAGAKHFNGLVDKVINKQVNAFKQGFADGQANQAQSYLRINYTQQGFVSQSQKTNYTSVRFNVDGYQAGMAHPYQQTLVVNYDVGNDKALELKDLFKPNSKYLQFLASTSIKQLLAKNLPDNSMINSGAAPKPANYQNWNLGLNGLQINFDEAQVAPRYIGRQVVTIPYNNLAAILNHQAACTLGVERCDVT